MTSSAYASNCLARKVCSRVVCYLPSVHYCADVEASAPKNETRDAGWKPCKGAKGVWRHLEGVTSRFPLQLWGFPRVSWGFLTGGWNSATKCGVDWREKVVSCSEDEKGVQGIWSLYESSPKIFQRHQWSSGRIHRCHLTRVRFPADAHCSHESVRAGEMARWGGHKKQRLTVTWLPGLQGSWLADFAEDTLAERLRRRPAKPMGPPRVGSNPIGVDL